MIGQEAHEAAKANHSSLSLVSLLLKLSPLNLVPGALVRPLGFLWCLCSVVAAFLLNLSNIFSFRQVPLRRKANLSLFPLPPCDPQVKNALKPVKADNGENFYMVDGIVNRQGPNYALAKRIQHWRAMVRAPSL